MKAKIMVDAPASIPVVSSDRDAAAIFYFDPSSRAVAVWHGASEFSGLNLDIALQYYSVAPAFISPSIGISPMKISDGALRWDSNRFGSWLVCEHNRKMELMWFDSSSGLGYDVDVCASVQLLLEYL